MRICFLAYKAALLLMNGIFLLMLVYVNYNMQGLVMNQSLALIFTTYVSFLP